MNDSDQTRLDPDDPRLTAYALGELEGDDAARMAVAVAADPALRAAVEEIRATAGWVTAALEAEPLPELKRPAHHVSYHTVRPARIFRLPYFAVAAMAAAACLVLVFALRELPLGEQAARQKAAALTGPEAAAKVEAAAPSAAAAPAPPGSPVEIQFAKETLGQPEPAGFPPGTMDHIATVVPNPPPSAIVASNAVTFGGATETGSLPAASAPLAAVASSPAAYAGEKVVRMEPFAVEAGAVDNYRASSTLAGSRVRGDLAFDTNGPAAAAVAGSDVTYGTAAKAAGGASWSAASEVPLLWAPSYRLPAASAAPPFATETYDYVAENDFLAAAENPLSTFAVDVDTASYSNVRRFLLGGRRPPPDAVRIEELVNYFAYDYAAPKASDPAPFAASLEVTAAPWAPTHRLVRIGLKGRELSVAARPAANLVFLVDVSGSMAPPNKLPLVRDSLRLLVDQLKPEDHVAIVTYAGTSGLALASTPARHRQEILDVLDRLQAGGRTNGAMGIQLAYDVAKANFVPGGVNRVILATDGDFNLGVTDRGDLVRLIQEKAKSGVFLTALGFGMGNYKDATLEQLADRGNGAYAYIDSAREARRVLAEQVNGTLATIAKDVKVQVEFNPARVQAYRLIGYENRQLKKEDFNNDRIDAGEIGAGHTVTALYEVIPAGVEWKPEATVDELKYRKPETGDRKAMGESSPVSGIANPVSQELLTVKIRYQAPEGDASRLLEFPLTDRGGVFADASADFKFAAAVAGFGMVLRDSPHRGATTLDQVERWAAEGTGADAGGYRSEFISLVKRAEEILPTQG
jgi:Ca-activated chloride channel family protein